MSTLNFFSQIGLNVITIQSGCYTYVMDSINRVLLFLIFKVNEMTSFVGMSNFQLGKETAD